MGGVDKDTWVLLERASSQICVTHEYKLGLEAAASLAGS